MFRSTGSYEPDRYLMIGKYTPQSFDPQALTSLTDICIKISDFGGCFDPQALTSLTPILQQTVPSLIRFDPQALTSLTLGLLQDYCKDEVSIHRLLRA